MYSYEQPRPSVTVDIALFGVLQGPQGYNVRLLLIQRSLGSQAFPGAYALPGGFLNVGAGIEQGEDLEDAAKRELEEETGIKVDHLNQFRTYGKPNRDPRGRVISIGHMGIVRLAQDDLNVIASDDAADASWVVLDKAKRMQLAFDHSVIVQDATICMKQFLWNSQHYASINHKDFTTQELEILTHLL